MWFFLKSGKPGGAVQTDFSILPWVPGQWLPQQCPPAQKTIEFEQ